MKLPVSRSEFVDVNSQVVQILTANQEHLTMTRNDVQQLAYIISNNNQSNEKSEQSNEGGMYR